MKIALVGMTLFGRSLALKLTQLKAEVIAIDSEIERIEQIKNDVAMAVALDATDVRELKKQGIHEVDALVCCMDKDFEASLLIAITAKRIGIRRVLSRTSTHTHAQILKQIGVDVVVLPEVEAAEDLGRRLLMPTLQNYLQLIEGYGIAEIAAPKEFHGRAIGDLRIGETYRVNLVSFRRVLPNNTIWINVVPTGADVLNAGDTITLCGNDTNLKKMSELPA